MIKKYDVLIIGGGPAGLSAALAIGRMGRTALVCDDGRYRNASSLNLNNFPSQDGIHPAEWRKKVKEDLKKYVTIQISQQSVKSIKKNNSSFEAVIGEEFIVSRKIILAYGLIDQLPSSQGFKELWGKSVLHCTFCHGFEVMNAKLGLMIDSKLAYGNLASIYALSKNLIIFTEGFDLDTEIRDKILNKNILIIDSKIKSLSYENVNLISVDLDNGDSIRLDKLFIIPKIPFLMRSNFGQNLGCEINDFGIFKVSERNETTVPGVFAAGDCMSMVQTTLFALASGNMAGAAAILSIFNDEF